MKREFELKPEIAEEFTKLSNDELVAMTMGFLNDYGSTLKVFGNNIGLNPKSITMWLNNKSPLSERSLKRVFAFLSEKYPRWRDYVGNNGTSASPPIKDA